LLELRSMLIVESGKQVVPYEQRAVMLYAARDLPIAGNVSRGRTRKTARTIRA
jgi:hypothetical protein